jgi:hypothetical protein
MAENVEGRVQDGIYYPAKNLQVPDVSFSRTGGVKYADGRFVSGKSSDCNKGLRVLDYLKGFIGLD